MSRADEVQINFGNDVELAHDLNPIDSVYHSHPKGQERETLTPQEPIEPPLTPKQKWQRTKLVVRIIYISITLVACLFVIIMSILAMAVGGPAKAGVPAQIAFYILNSCVVLLCVLIGLLEFDFWSWLMNYFKFAKSYLLRSILIMYVGVACYGSCVNYANASYQTAQEVSAYILFGVGVLHFLFGLLCLDYIFGLNRWNKQ
ncbi:hypothetical protein AKO1_011053 [Acrasis kona]|uniref:MARVEL domain-containing protein n=1 Tax=Acrasis kona TaxID=1008807 RepID=A0AAW2YTJ4_9EUKA